ncbi:MAG: nucleotidyl transferase AbiEii/AbiGii toxin family protein [Dermatophilaceae bacterium]
MSYQTAQAFRMALEQRLLVRSAQTRVAVDRLRRRVLFERIVARLQAAEPGQWVLKGGMALEVRLQDAARLTKDIDLGLRDDVENEIQLHERISRALRADLDRDGFVLNANRPAPLGADGTGQPTWRTRITSSLASRFFGSIQLDVSPRAYELDRTDRVELSNLLDRSSADGGHMIP